MCKRLFRLSTFNFWTPILLLAVCLISSNAHAQLLDSLSLDTTTAFTSIDQAMKNPEKVVKLVLKREHLKAFPKEIFQFTNLQYLDLSKNPSQIVRTLLISLTLQ